MKPTAFLDWSLDTECPHCGREVDLVKYDSDHGDYSIAEMILQTTGKTWKVGRLEG